MTKKVFIDFKIYFYDTSSNIKHYEVLKINFVKNYIGVISGWGEPKYFVSNTYEKRSDKCKMQKVGSYFKM
jgi:hypothetical protein